MENTYLLINELAKLFNVTTHTLRFYEEKGLLAPASRTEKDYRLYDFDAIAKLEEILMLRSLGMPIEAIIDYFNNKGLDSYTLHLSELESHIDKSIADLMSQKKNIQYSKDLISNYNTYKNQFFVETFPERYLLYLDEIIDLNSFQVNEKSFFETVRKATNQSALKASKDLVFFITETCTMLYLLINPIDLSRFDKNSLMKLPETKYVCAFHAYVNEKDYLKLLHNLDKYIRKNKLSAQDYLVDIYSSEYTIFADSKNLSFLQIPLKN